MKDKKKIYTNMLVPYDWFDELTRDIMKPDEPNVQLGKDRLWQLFISLRSDEQAMTGDMQIDYPVAALLAQEAKMRKEMNNRDLQIAKMKQDGMKSDEIGAYFGVTGGAIRKSDGWTKMQEVLANAEV